MGEEPTLSHTVMCKHLDPNEKHLINKEGNIFDPVLFVNDLN